MKALLVAASLAAFALPAAAQDYQDPGQAAISAPGEIKLPAKYSRIWAGEFDSLLGTYDLSNGQTMSMTKRMNRKFIQVGDARPTEVVAIGDYDFVSLDEKYRVVMSEPGFGDVTGYVLIDTRKPSGGISQAAPEVHRFRFALS